MTGPISKELLTEILHQYPLPWNGIHGISHWARVLENGRRLAVLTGAKIEVVELFAVLHDSRRTNEGVDYIHGPQGAKYAAKIHDRFFWLPDEDFALLQKACAGHTNGHTRADVTVQTCWDADRLDLGRVGITPQPKRLCTPAARDPAILAWAESRSRILAVPELIRTEWGLEYLR
jgi:uncharacterized protein